MKAICVEKAGGNGLPVIEVGEEVTIIGESNSPISGIRHVQIAEYSTFGWGGPVYYAAFKFSPLDGPCEISLLEERVEQEMVNLDRSYRDLVHEVETVTP